MRILGIIPARYESSRFPGKPLAEIAGKSMIQRVYEQCMKAKSLSMVVIATDDERIFDAAVKFGGCVMITSANHLNGTSRCAEVNIRQNELSENPGYPDAPYDYIINIQGDEPLIDPNQIDELAELFEDSTAEIVTQVKVETDLSLLENTNIVKAVLDENSYATDFVRNYQPSSIIHQPFYKHIGMYGYKAHVVMKLIKLAPTQNELQHHLEQLRWLDNGFKIKAGITEYESLSVDTKEDLRKVIDIFQAK